MIHCKSDIETLQESYDKYKDKNGKKARSLKMRIEAFKSFHGLIKEVIEDGKSK